MKYLLLFFTVILAFTFSVNAQNKAAVASKIKTEKKIEQQSVAAVSDTNKAKEKVADVKVETPVKESSIKDNFWNAFIITCKGMGGVLAFMFLFFFITKILDKMFPQKIERKE
ncbi:MAG: hypothetical protein Q8903_05855 [Bacteroidota bacterium]|nr:hypothetical protein [Bacteroidota bacterium]